MNIVEFGDCREIMRRWHAFGFKVQTCITSPPYFGLRDYGHDGQIGLETTPDEYIAAMVEVFRCVRNVLSDDGTLWLNIGDTYAANRSYQVPSTKGGMKPKDLIGIPWMLAFALRADGWYLRQDIIWSKPNPMPESVRDRCTKAHEYIFLLSKSEKYYFDGEAVKEPAEGTAYRRRLREEASGKVYSKGKGHEGRNDSGGSCISGSSETRNRRSVWTVATTPYKGAHFATFPPALIEPCILAGSQVGGIVLDPFMGSGTTAMVASQLGRQYMGCELNPEYEALQNERLSK